MLFTKNVNCARPVQCIFIDLICFSFQVIVALLKKFKVADNPRKFALFECYQEEDNHSKMSFVFCIFNLKITLICRAS